MQMKPLSIALLGCGRIARSVHLPVLNALPGARVVALADAEADALEQAGSVTPGARRYEDYASAVEDADVDAVVVCLPPLLHGVAARLALGGCKHVYVEKPLAVGVDDALELVTAWRKQGVVGAVGFNYRADRAYMNMRELMRGGERSRLVHGRSTFSSAPVVLPVWKAKLATGGGALLDLGSHHFDLYHHALGGRVVEVDARTRSRKSDEDTVSVRAMFADGVTVESHFAFGTLDEDRFELFCEGAKHSFDRYTKAHEQGRPASFRYGRASVLREAGSQLAGALARLTLAPGEPSFAASLGAFVAAAAGKGEALADFDDGLRSLRLVDAARRSAEQARPVCMDSEAV